MPNRVGVTYQSITPFVRTLAVAIGETFTAVKVKKIVEATATFSLLGFVAGCASIGGERQIIGIDSEPRGLSVIEPVSGRRLGETPLFALIERDRYLDLLINHPRDATKVSPLETKVEVLCHYRWALALFGNGWLLAAHPLVGAGALAIDLWNGSAYDCPAIVKVRSLRSIPDSEADSIANGQKAVDSSEAPALSQTQRRPCRRFLIAPIADVGFFQEQVLRKAWRRSKAKRLKGCDIFVKADDIRQYWSYVKWKADHQSLESLSRERLNHLGFHSGATHVIFLQRLIEPNTDDRSRLSSVAHPAAQTSTVQRHKPGRRIILQAKTYDLMTRAKTDIPGLAEAIVLRLPERKKTFWHDIRQAVGTNINLLPNSVTLGISDADNLAMPKTGLPVIADETVRGLPHYLSAWGLTTVQHPDGFNSYDFSLFLQPSLLAAYEHRKVVFNNALGFAEPAAIKTFLVTPYYRGGVTFHSPVGSLSMSLGFGIGLYQTAVDDQPATYGSFSTAVSEGFYTAFLTKHLFLQIGFSVIAVEERDFGKFQFDKSRIEVMGRVGYFYPIDVYRP